MRSLKNNLEADYPSLSYASSTLISVVQELSSARDINEIAKIVRAAARLLVRADGATLVFRENDLCHYFDEDAIGPLWKGMRFPMSACISGWCMVNKKQVTIGDIYEDARIPHDVYRKTFVKSLVMTPIRKTTPIGAIGTYWANSNQPSDEDLDVLQALADSTSTAIKNVSILEELKKKVSDLEKTNHRLSQFTWMASHDLKEPLRSISLHTSYLEGEFEKLFKKKDLDLSDIQSCIDENIVSKIKFASKQAHTLISDLLEFTKCENHEVNSRSVDLNEILKEVLEGLKDKIDENQASIHSVKLPTAWVDPVLISRVFRNIILNAIKYRAAHIKPLIYIDSEEVSSFWKITVKDNGIGIDKADQGKIFEFFSRLHGQSDYPGSGIGLALVKNIIEDLGGAIGVDSKLGLGSVFYFTVPRDV